MTKIGAYTPETSRMILDVVKYLVDSGFVITRPGRGTQNHLPQESPIYIRNDSGEEMPPFACMQATGTVEAGGQNYVTVDKPVDTSGASGRYLFNSLAPVEDGKYGIAYVGPLVRVLTDGSTVTCGDAWQPVVNQWYVATGGSLLSAVGDDDIETDVMRAFIQTSGGGSSKLVYTPVAGIAARSGTSISSASCTIVGITSNILGATSGSLTVYNPWPSAIPGSYYLIAKQENETGEWVADFPGVLNVRWDSPDLEQTVNGTTYTIIDTAEECP